MKIFFLQLAALSWAWNAPGSGKMRICGQPDHSQDELIFFSAQQHRKPLGRSQKWSTRGFWEVGSKLWLINSIPTWLGSFCQFFGCPLFGFNYWDVYLNFHNLSDNNYFTKIQLDLCMFWLWVPSLQRATLLWNHRGGGNPKKKKKKKA